MNDRADLIDSRLADSGVEPPMANGELLFEAPWQARAFGLAHALCDTGCYTWDDFRDALIAEIARWEGGATPGEDYAYYDRFLAALEALLAERGLADPQALSRLCEQLAERPHGHDH